MFRPCFAVALLSSSLLCGSAHAADKLIFQFGWVPGGDRAAYYLAKKEGLFAAQGLDVELRSGKGSTDTLSKLAAGSADMGEGGLDALFHAKAQTEMPVTAVMSVYTDPPEVLITTTDSGISSLKDVAGKRVATSALQFGQRPMAFPVAIERRRSRQGESAEGRRDRDDADAGNRPR